MTIPEHFVEVTRQLSKFCDSTFVIDKQLRNHLLNMTKIAQRLVIDLTSEADKTELASTVKTTQTQTTIMNSGLVRAQCLAMDIRYNVWSDDEQSCLLGIANEILTLQDVLDSLSNSHKTAAALIENWSALLVKHSVKYQAQANACKIRACLADIALAANETRDALRDCLRQIVTLKRTSNNEEPAHNGAVNDDDRCA